MPAEVLTDYLTMVLLGLQQAQSAVTSKASKKQIQALIDRQKADIKRLEAA